MIRNRIFILLMFFAVLIGCSSTNDPLTVSETIDPNVSTSISRISNNLIIGAYEGIIDLETLEYHFAPLRDLNTIGDSFQVDLTYFLDGVPCGNCIRIGDIHIDADANLEVTFEVKHPFSATDDRLDLHVFDVRGILVNKNPDITVFNNIMADMNSDGSVDTPAAGDMNFLLNADGLTTFFDLISEQYLGLNIQGNLNPYKLYFVDPSEGNFNPAHPNGVEDVTSPRGHNVFKQGTNFTDVGASQVYNINAGLNTTLNFLFILDGSYGHAATFKNTYYHPDEPGSRGSPKFFMPEFNRKEVWKLDVEIIDNNLSPYNSSSTLKLEVNACDWQAGVTSSGTFNEDGALDDIRYPSDVNSVTLDIPGILSNIKSRELSQSTGNGSNTDPYSWEFNLTNELSAQPGEFYGLVSVRDEICGWLDGTTPPFGVKQDATTVDYRDFATYQSFKIEIPGLDGIFQADPYRLNLDIVTGITQPTSADTSLDIAVVENDDSDIDGVYMPDANQGVTRYTHDYSEAEFHGPGFLPKNDTGTHPAPDTAMPLRRLDANSEGVTGAGYFDANETYFPNDPDPPILPAGNIFHLSYCVIPPPMPPFGSDFPLDRFAGYFMADSDDPLTPSVNEYEEEDPMPIEIWDDFNGDLGCIWETTKFVNTGSGYYDLLYFGASFEYPPNSLDPPISSQEFAGSLTGIPAGDLNGVDKSDNGYIYYAFSGQDTYDMWNYNSLLAGLDANDPSGNPMIGGIPIYSGNVIDMELLPYDDSMPRIINGIEQTAPIAVCLTDNKTIEFIDSITGQVLQVIDGSADGSISGIPKHLDVGDTSFTVHVTHLQASTPRVTVYILK